MNILFLCFSFQDDGLHQPALEAYDKRKIERSTDKHHEREYHYHASYDAIDDNNACVIEFLSYFVYKPSKSPPPQQCSGKDTKIAEGHL